MRQEDTIGPINAIKNKIRSMRNGINDILWIPEHTSIAVADKTVAGVFYVKDTSLSPTPFQCWVPLHILSSSIDSTVDI